MVRGGILLSATLLGGLICSAQWKQRRQHRGNPDDVSVLYEDSGRLYLASAMPVVVALMVLGLLLEVSDKKVTQGHSNTTNTIYSVNPYFAGLYFMD